MTINGARLSEDIEKIYIDLLKMANVKTVFLGAIPEDLKNTRRSVSLCARTP